MWWRRDPKDLETLRDDLASLKRKVSALELEWSDAQDKLTRRLRGLATTYQRMAESEATLTTEAAPVLSESDLLTLGRLPPTQRAIQEQILRRRKAAINGGR